MPETTESPEPRAPRRLPLGPFGMLVATAVALLVAAGAAGLALNLLHDDSNGAVDVRDALDDVTVTPLVPKDQSVVEIGDKVPDVRLQMLDGSTDQLSSFVGSGNPVIMNFWSSTCAPCLNEMPALEAVHKQLQGRVTILGIDSQDTVDSGKAMLEQTGVTYANARDPRGEISTVFGAIALPRTVLIDSDGRIVATHSGELNVKSFTKLLKEHDFPTP